MVCLVRILEKTDRVITAPHWICMFIEVMVVAEYNKMAGITDLMDWPLLPSALFIQFEILGHLHHF